MFTPIVRNNQILGYGLKTKEFFIFYGTKNLDLRNLKKTFPEYQFCFIHQVHGDFISPAQPHPPFPKADAHWTFDKKQALVIQTADCLPLFLIKDKKICAIHAGWRGIEKKIALNALKIFKDPNNIEVSLGPHITHFIVDPPVAEKLAQSGGKKWITPLSAPFKGKYKASLMGIVKEQISSQAKVKKWHLLPLDTFSSKLFYSFRKTAEKNKRQYSFIVLL